MNKKKLSWQIPFLLFLILGTYYVLTENRHPRQTETTLTGQMAHIPYKIIYLSSPKEKDLKPDLLKQMEVMQKLMETHHTEPTYAYNLMCQQIQQTLKNHQVADYWIQIDHNIHVKGSREISSSLEKKKEPWTVSWHDILPEKMARQMDQKTWSVMPRGINIITAFPQQNHLLQPDRKLLGIIILTHDWENGCRKLQEILPEQGDTVWQDKVCPTDTLIFITQEKGQKLRAIYTPEAQEFIQK